MEIVEKKEDEIFKYIQCIKNIFNYIHENLFRIIHLITVHLNHVYNVDE